MLSKIGYVKDIKFDELFEFAVANQEDLSRLYYNDTKNGGIDDDCLDAIRKDHWKYVNGDYKCDFGDFADWIFCYNREDYGKALSKKLEHIKKCIAHYKELGGKLEIVFESLRFFVIRYSVRRYIGLPKEFVDVERPKDLDALTLGEINAKLLGGTSDGQSALAVLEKQSGLSQSNTVWDVRGHLVGLECELAQKEKEAKERYELKRKEMEEALQKMKEEQDKQLSVLNAEVEKLKDSIFIIECDIFALRSLFGDTFTLTQLASGKTSDAPLVLYQKFRFLDEEFALLAARQFSKFDGKHGTTIEIFKNKAVQERFLPADRCITFFRTSRDQKYYAYDAELDGLAELEYYHGSQVGMLIRNGENVWLSFIDEEVFVEDNLFESELTVNEQLSKLKKNWDGEYDFKKDIIVPGKTKLRDPIVKKGISRMFLFFILDGLIRSTNIFEDLKGINIRVPSEKIIFSSADNQIGLSKYPDFKTYFTEWRKHAEELRVDDPILIVERGAASKWVGSHYGGHEEHRSRGYQNRARDAEDISAGVNKISYIEVHDAWYEELVDEKPYKTADDNNGTPIYYKRRVDERDKDKPNVYYDPNYSFYVSAVRHPWDFERRNSGRINNVNLEVYEEDFCPLVYCNSNYVLAWLEQKAIGDWYKGNYVYLVENCFHKALQFLQEREQHEMALLLPLIPEWSNTPDELDVLLGWRKQNKVRNFTEWQAKRFAKWYKESGGKK